MPIRWKPLGAGLPGTVSLKESQLSDGQILKWDNTAGRWEASGILDTSTGTVVTLTDTNVDIAGANLRLTTTGKGIDFSATSDAAGMTSELLDDYEEGTWTPTLENTATTGVTTYSAARVGWYTKIGRMVFITGRVQATDITGPTTGDNVWISGLPYAADTTTHNQQVLAVISGGANLVDGDSMALNIDSGNPSRLRVYYYGNTGGVVHASFGGTNEILNNTVLSFSGAYMT